MKKVLSVLIITFCITGISSLANAALILTQVDAKTATVVGDSQVTGFYLSIPSTIDYTIDPIPPLEIGPVEEPGDGLDWIPVFIASAELLPAGTLATLTLTGPEIFAIGSYELNLWDETATNNLGTLSIVPEPATLVMLGMGGLLIRKRK